LNITILNFLIAVELTLENKNYAQINLLLLTMQMDKIKPNRATAQILETHTENLDEQLLNELMGSDFFDVDESIQKLKQYQLGLLSDKLKVSPEHHELSKYVRNNEWNELINAVTTLHKQTKKLEINNALLLALTKTKLYTKAVAVLDKMKSSKIKPNEFSYNILIEYCCSVNNFQEALSYYRDMQKQGILPDLLTYSLLIINNSSNTGSIEDILRVFAEMQTHKLTPTRAIITALDMLCTAYGNPKLWNTYIGSYGK